MNCFVPIKIDIPNSITEIDMEDPEGVVTNSPPPPGKSLPTPNGTVSHLVLILTLGYKLQHTQSVLTFYTDVRQT